MDIRIRKIQFKQAYDIISQHEYEFIRNNIPCSDDGTYKITNAYLDKLIKKFSGREELRGLIKTFFKYIKLGKGYLYFRIE